MSDHDHTATLGFNLDAPEGEARLLEAINGGKYRAVLQSVDNYLRNRIKHGNLPEEVADALDAARDRLIQECNEAGVPLWE